VFTIILDRIRKSDFSVFDDRETETRPNTLIEIGTAIGLAKPYFYFNYSDKCVWQAGLAHFGILFWPTSGRLRVWESFLPVVVAAVGMWESLLSDFQGLWEGWENSSIVFPCFP
jgi:hypothetical protein